MHPLRSCLLAVPVIAGLIGLGVGALAGGALSGHSDRNGQGYDEPAYAPEPSYGYAVPGYVARPHVISAPPPAYYYGPPSVAYPVPPPAYQGGPAYARWGGDD